MGAWMDAVYFLLSPATIVAGLVIVLGVTGVVAWIAWVIQLIFFWQKPGFSMLACMSALLGIVLGLIPTFLLPAFREIFETFGASLPVLAKLLFDYGYLLWTPLVLIVISWWPLRSHRARRRWYLACFLAEALLLYLVLGALTVSPGLDLLAH